MLVAAARIVGAFVWIFVDEVSISEVEAMLLQVGLPLILIPNVYDLIVVTICSICNTLLEPRSQSLLTGRRSCSSTTATPPTATARAESGNTRPVPDDSEEQGFEATAPCAQKEGIIEALISPQLMSECESQTRESQRHSGNPLEIDEVPTPSPVRERHKTQNSSHSYREPLNTKVIIGR